MPVGCPEFQGGIRQGLQAGRHRDRPAHRKPGLDRRDGNERRDAGKSLAAVQRRLGSSGSGRPGQHDHRRRADHLRHREAMGRRRSDQVRRPRAHRESRRGEPSGHVGVRPDEAHEGVRQHGPSELRRRGILRGRRSLLELHHLRQHQERLGAERDGASLRLQHGRHAARRQMDHRAGLRLARAGLAADGRAEGSPSPCADNSRWCSVATPTRDATRS